MNSITWGPVARRAAGAAALALLPAVLWCLTHRYRGLVGDAALYAVQALSRTDAGLAHDVFLSDASQDRYTIFSPIYAFFIERLGLQEAAASLLMMFKACFYFTAWLFSRKLFDTRTALLTIALLIVVPIEYGAFHVFRVAEDMLTARSMAEALAMTALCLHVYGRKNVGLVIAAVALSIHALMALPMVLLLLTLRLSTRSSLLGALAVITAALGAASTAAMAPQATSGLLRVMDPTWLDMVRERSQFVFLQLWRLTDWESNARPFVSLGLGTLVIRDERIRKLCAAAMIVGAAGLTIAFLAGVVGPTAVLLQGQAWRWTWVTGLVSLLMLAPTVSQLWRSERLRASVRSPAACGLADPRPQWGLLCHGCPVSMVRPQTRPSGCNAVSSRSGAADRRAGPRANHRHWLVGSLGSCATRTNRKRDFGRRAQHSRPGLSTCRPHIPLGLVGAA